MKKCNVSPGQRQATLLLLDEMCDSSTIFNSDLFFQSKFEHAEKLIFYYQTTNCDDRKFILMKNILDTLPLIDHDERRKSLLDIVMPILLGDFKIHEHTILSWADPEGENYIKNSEISLFMDKAIKSR